MSDTIIKIEDVDMKFNMATDKISGLKEYAIKFIKRELFYKEFLALQNINLEIRRGEIIGIIGLNGAGKSTMLKVISGILKPSNGNVTINGNIAPLIELGAGFDPELSGMENIYLNGAVLGMSRKYMDKKLDEIIAFSELEEFINNPVKNYSSGMYARLGFSIATCIEPDILIVDEILSVGDYKFQQKSRHRIEEMINDGTTIILVSHSIEEIKELCNRVVWLEKGKIKQCGGKEVISQYEK
ncbi:ABC transporter ATP-binding protein [Clostridioides sp. ES-S-0123-01]|uniref:ABC transporter ATP-binding protein n=1 Tax=Clostridioides sp. ES-S-0123-01 TaxID=2770783 RepID=UPI001D11B23C|nr:ABC transporter ATP-binding protein [Clostridioides sp. ES-S-0123-01]